MYKKLRPVMYRSDKYCPKPYDYLYINIDGKATPCCDLPRYEVGNVLKQSIDEIWHSENMQYFREHQNDVCGTLRRITVETFKLESPLLGGI